MLNAALKSFTEVLNSNYVLPHCLMMQALTRKQYANRVTVLDSRAATYTRLGKYGLALRDAKQMVVGDERDARVCIQHIQIID